MSLSLARHLKNDISNNGLNLFLDYLFVSIVCPHAHKRRRGQLNLLKLITLFIFDSETGPEKTEYQAIRWQYFRVYSAPSLENYNQLGFTRSRETVRYVTEALI